MGLIPQYIYWLIHVPRKRWLHPDVTETLLNGILSHNQAKLTNTDMSSACLFSDVCHGNSPPSAT